MARYAGGGTVRGKIRTNRVSQKHGLAERQSETMVTSFDRHARFVTLMQGTVFPLTQEFVAMMLGASGDTQGDP